MNIHQLYYFKCVCKHRNITKAAEELHISQPAITRSIRELEQEMGVCLLTRTNKNVILTNEGELFLHRSTAILSDLESLIDEMKDLGDLRRTILRIGVPPAIGTIILPQLNLIAYQKLGLELEIFDYSSDDVIRAVENDELDLAIALMEDEFYPNIDFRVLRHTGFHFCTSCQNPLSKRSSIPVPMLENERIIFFHPGDLMKSLFEKYAVTPKFILRSNQLQTIKDYLKANLASTLQFPEVFASEPSITTIPLEDPVALDIVILKKRGKRLFAGASQLYQYLIDHPTELFQLL